MKEGLIYKYLVCCKYNGDFQNSKGLLTLFIRLIFQVTALKHSGKLCSLYKCHLKNIINNVLSSDSDTDHYADIRKLLNSIFNKWWEPKPQHEVEFVHLNKTLV
jgi:hypothetical protein